MRQPTSRSSAAAAAAAAAGSPPRSRVGVDDRARGRDQPRGGVGREGGPQGLGAAALRAHAREQEERARHQLAQARQVLGPRGAARPRPRRPARPRPSSSASAARRSCTGGSPRVLQVGGAGVRGAAPARTPRRPCSPRPPRPAARGCRAPSSGLAVKASAPRPGTAPKGSGSRPPAPGRRPSRSPGRRRACRRRSPAARARAPRRPSGAQRGPAGRAEALEARQLGLDGHAGRPGGLDGQPAVASHRRCGPDGRVAARVRVVPRAPPGHSAAGSGSRPEHDLAAPLLYRAASRSGREQSATS